MTFEETFSFTNLLKTHRRCRCGKAHKKEVVVFELSLSENLVKISKEIENGYKISKYKRFLIFEPKERVIEALPYKDRLVQMALCRGIVEPIMEKRLIFDNYACRKNKGTHFALRRLECFLHKFFSKHKNKGYFLKIDIKKYFASINHDILKSKLSKCGFEKRALELMFAFIDSNGEGCGLPLGNQTSQWFALLYLDEIDRLIKEKLGVKFYVRYMDDLILIDQSKQYLKYCLEQVRLACKNNLNLSLNTKTQIGRLSDGIDFLGFRNILTSSGKVVRLLRAQNKKKIRKRLKFLKLLKQKSIVDDDYIQLRLNSFCGHLKISNSIHFFNRFLFHTDLIT